MIRHSGIIGVIFLVATINVFADDAANGRLPPFSHYEVILSRKPFGDLTKPAASSSQSDVPDQSAVEQAKEEQALARQVDMVAVNRTPRGKIAVGFIDKGEKPPKNYYLNVGDSSGGFTVVDADFTEETATIEKDGVSICLKLGKGMIPKKGAEEVSAPAVPPVPPSQPQVQAPPPQPSVTTVGRLGLRRAGSGGRPVVDRNSYLEKLRQRQANRSAQTQENTEEIAKLREEIRKSAEQSKEEAAKRERQINLDLIARGQEPLSPIVLTPEEDAELVRKGALSAQDSEPAASEPQ